MAAYRRVDDLTVTCRLTACTPGSAPGPTLGIEYGKAFTFTFFVGDTSRVGDGLAGRPIILTDWLAGR